MTLKVICDMQNIFGGAAILNSECVNQPAL